MPAKMSVKLTKKQRDACLEFFEATRQGHPGGLLAEPLIGLGELRIRFLTYEQFERVTNYLRRIKVIA